MAAQAVLFDAVGTLIYPSPSVAEAYAAAAARQGLRVAEEEVSRRFQAAFAAEEDFDSAECGGSTSPRRERQRWQRIVAAVFPDAPAPQELFAALWAHFESPGHWGVYGDAQVVLARLQDAGLPWGIASNFDERLWGVCRGLPLLSGCRRLFVSADIGWRKPSRNFFRAVEDKLRLNPDEILLVGDDAVNDYLAARAVGWQSLLLDRRGVAAADEHRIPTESRIASLTDLAW